MLDKTPKVVRNFSFANLHTCMSPLIFSSAQKEDREEKVFQPCILFQSSEPSISVLSPSKMLSLNSPTPSSHIFFGDAKPQPISKRLFFGPQ